MADLIGALQDQLRVQKARRVELVVTIDGVDTKDYFERRLTSFEYVDNAENKADEVTIELQDRDQQWLYNWLPEKGCEITAKVICQDWPHAGERATLDCGKFTCDEPAEYSGPPGRVSIKAITASLTGELRDTARSKAWEHYSLERVAQEIASKNGLLLYYDAEPFDFERQDQCRESDLAFLTRLASARGVSVKVYSGRLVLFDGKKADSQAPAVTINRAKGNDMTASQYSFKVSSDGTGYDSAEVQYHDPKTRKTHKAKATRKGGKKGKKNPWDKSEWEGGWSEIMRNREGQEKTLTSNQRCESQADAERTAKSLLRNANKTELTGSVTLLGNPGLAAGMTVTLEDFGKFSGKFFIEKATHRVFGGGGYETSLELRQALEY